MLRKSIVQYFVHPTSEVLSSDIGIGSKIWQYVVILKGAVIGDNCNICSHCFIENDVIIGNRVTIKSGVQLWDGLRLEDDVFVGPNASFANDIFPRSKKKPIQFLQTVIETGASIGSGATVLPGIAIGRNAMVAAGAVVTRSVPANAIAAGNPAKIIGYIDTGLSNDAINGINEFSKGSQITQVRGVTKHLLPRITDIRGSLTVGEFDKDIPFPVRRYFIVFNVPNLETRGEHAHFQCHQFLICISGSCRVVADDGTHRQEFLLDRPDVGFHIPPMVWGIQYKYSQDAVLIVYASHNYDKDDYIRNYAEFLKLVGAMK